MDNNIELMRAIVEQKLKDPQKSTTGLSTLFKSARDCVKGLLADRLESRRKAREIKAAEGSIKTTLAEADQIFQAAMRKLGR